MTRTDRFQVKVLIAERTLSIAELIARNLKAQGYAIAGIVNSAEKAIEFATVTVPDIVLLDLPLPGEIDTFAAGWKIFSEIRCPVVYMTTQVSDVYNQNPSVNPYGFLLKPFTADELTATIDQTLHQHQLSTIRDRPPTTPPALLNHDEQFLPILAAASLLSPLPKVAFTGDRWEIYTSTLTGIDALKKACRQYYHYPCQLFTWNWETGGYQPIQ